MMKLAEAYCKPIIDLLLYVAMEHVSMRMKINWTRTNLVFVQSLICFFFAY